MEMGKTNHKLDGTVERTTRYPYYRFYTGNQTNTFFPVFNSRRKQSQFSKYCGVINS